MPTAGTWVKMLVTYVASRWALIELFLEGYANEAARGATLCIGGPYLVWYVTPTEEELFKVCCTRPEELRLREFDSNDLCRSTIRNCRSGHCKIGNRSKKNSITLSTS